MAIMTPIPIKTIKPEAEIISVCNKDVGIKEKLKCFFLKHKYKKTGKEEREYTYEDNDIIIQKYICVRCGKKITNRRWTNYGGGLMSLR